MNRQLMVHMVYGYPEVQTSKRLLKQFDESGVSYIEVQIPFSDPLADGPVLTSANSKAAEHISPSTVLADLQMTVPYMNNAQILIMCYFQTIFSYGVRDFCRQVAIADVHGVIVPDLPYDQNEYETLLLETQRCNIELIPVLSPNMSSKRLKQYVQSDTKLVYLTARSGVTGTATTNQQFSKVMDFLEAIKTVAPNCKVALGFGIRSSQAIAGLPNGVDIAVVGSALTEHLDRYGYAEAIKFTKQLLRACDERVST